MKFGKRLKQQTEETLPEWRDKFVSYKHLKKLVKLISAGAAAGEVEANFVRLLDSEIDKLNAFFVEQEEDFIIRMREVQERIRISMEDCGPLDTEYTVELGRIRKDIVNLHGEMVLLENYSSINYTGLGKILKKYDKRTGRVLRLPVITKVLEQPFYTTELISKLVNECERTMEAIFPRKREQQIDHIIRGERDGRHAWEQQSVFRSTVAALVTMQEMRKGSSTYGHFSLPPLSLPDHDLLLQSLQQLPSPIPTQ